MKNKYIKSLMLSLAIGGVMTLSSCEDYLNVENPSTISQDAVFNSVGYANSAVIGIYNQLIGDDTYGQSLATVITNGADDFRVGGAYNPLDRRGISGFGVHPDNQELEDPFVELYKGIERANIAIKYIPASPLYTSGTAAEQRTLRKLYGEALTLRAQFYYELIRNWGDVPAQFEPAADITDLYLPKTNRDEIYDRILEDLKLAAELVPWRSETGDPATRLSKAAVKGLRARIALARGGYSLRSETGKMERREDYRTYYEIARNETRDIIQSGEHRLNPSYENVFKNLHTSSTSDPELIFEVGAYGSNSKTDSKLGYSNGIRIDANSRFGRANGQLEAIPTYFYEFDSIADVRRDVTLAYFELIKGDLKQVTRSTLMRDGKFRRYWTNLTGTTQNLGINWPIMRYSDILLMFAEAENELNNGPTAEAINAYEAVRKRAFIDQFENRIGVTPRGKEAFFDAIVQERLLELGGEGIRKYDLIRWNLLEAKIAETRANLIAFRNGVGRYSNTPAVIYNKPTDFLNIAVPQELVTLDLFGGPVAKVMYTPAPASTPAGYNAVNWRTALNADFAKNFAVAFKPNQSELLPLPSAVINRNYRLSQSYGY